MFSKEEIIETAIQDSDLTGARVLLAGGGRRSARAVIDTQPSHLTVVCVPDDKNKVDRIFNELGGDRNDAHVIGGSLTTRNLFEKEEFDFILADYLGSKVDLLAPRQHIDVLQFFKSRLKPGGTIVYVDIEPDLPPKHKIESPNGRLEVPAKPELIDKTDLDSRTRYLWYRRIRKLVVDLALNQGIPGFQEIPGDWVERWLMGVGFINVRPQMSSRILEIEMNQAFEKRMRSFIELIEDEKIRKYVEALMDRTEALIREICPFEYEQNVYIIKAEKK